MYTYNMHIIIYLFIYLFIAQQLQKYNVWQGEKKQKTKTET